MKILNEVWIRGKEDMKKTVEVLLRSGYDVRIRIDQESEMLTRTPSYLLSFVDRDFCGFSFEAVSEDGRLLTETNED